MFAPVVGFQPFRCAAGREWELSSSFDPIAPLRFNCIGTLQSPPLAKLKNVLHLKDVLYE